MSAVALRHAKEFGARHSVEAVLLAVLALEVLVLGALEPVLVGSSSISSTLQNVGPIAMIAPAECLVIIAGGIDLSVGSMVSVTGVLFGLLGGTQLPLPLIFVIVVLAGIAMGTINGVLTCWLRVEPLIATLATLFIYATIAEVIVGSDSLTSIPGPVISLGNKVLFGYLPEQTLVVIAVALVAALLLTRTVFGRELTFVGGSEPASRFAGIAVDRRRFQTYLGTGAACAIAAILQAGFFASVRGDSGTGLELVVITACLVGGVDVFGGVGSVFGVMVGCAIVAVLEAFMDLKNINGTEQQIAVGALLVLTVGAQQLVDPLRSSWQRRRAERTHPAMQEMGQSAGSTELPASSQTQVRETATTTPTGGEV